eukprot:m.16445 g.16445  ORF g.16445 m.16445 type:complete len:305 (-) comp7077_c0_seq2:1702-2616(-)
MDEEEQLAGYDRTLKQLISELQATAIANDELQQDVQRMQIEVNAQPDEILIETSKLYDLSKEELMHAHLRVLQRKALEEARNRELENRIRVRTNQVIESNAATLKLAELHQANLSQVAFHKSLKKRIEDARVFKLACRRQERAIADIEHILTQSVPPGAGLRQITDGHMSGAPSSQTPMPSPLYELLRQENDRLKAMLGSGLDGQGKGNVMKGAGQDKSVRFADAAVHGDFEQAACESSSKTIAQESEQGQVYGTSSERAVHSQIQQLEREVEQLEKQLVARAKQQGIELMTLELELLECESSS